MAQLTELILPCLDAAQARTVIEVGAYAGDLTRVLVRWAAQSGARIVAVDPAPQPGLEELAAAHPELELVRRRSLEALSELAPADAVVIDGDHNHFTVSGELRAIAAAAEDELPLLLFHDVGWPHGRRDDYFDPEQIPAGSRHPLAGDQGGLTPGEAGLTRGGLPYPRSAAREGGPRNGVLTAIEDFVSGRDHLRLAVVPVFFGLGVAWDTRRSYAGALAELLEPFDRHPVLERLEANRLTHLARAYRRQTEIWELERRLARQRAVLDRLLSSSAVAVAERLSRLRARAGIATEQPIVSKAEIRRALEE